MEIPTEVYQAVARTVRDGRRAGHSYDDIFEAHVYSLPYSWEMLDAAWDMLTANNSPCWVCGQWYFGRATPTTIVYMEDDTPPHYRHETCTWRPAETPV